MWPGIVMLIGGLVNSLLQSRNDRKNTQRTIAGQKELSQYAFSQNQTMAQEAYNRDVAMWERQNQYNDPRSQMSRLQGAGLNPNLVYGSGSATGNQSGPPPSFSPASYQAPDIQYKYSPIQLPEMLGQYQNFQMRQAQVDNVRAQTQNTRMRTLSENFGLARGKELLPYQADIMRGEVERLPLVQQKLAREDQNTYMRNMMLGAELGRFDVVTEGIERENLYKRYRNDWMKQGITSSDNPFFRIISRMWQDSGLSMSDLRRKGDDINRTVGGWQNTVNQKRRKYLRPSYFGLPKGWD